MILIGKSRSFCIAFACENNQCYLVIFNKFTTTGVCAGYFRWISPVIYISQAHNFVFKVVKNVDIAIIGA